MPLVMPSVLISGTLTLDTIERGDVVYRDVPGGSALYAAAAARLWRPVQVTGTVGTDFPPAALDVPGVSREAVEVLAGPTFRWHARYTDDGAHRTTVSRDRGVAEGRLPPVGLTRAPHAILLGSTHPQVQHHVLDHVRRQWPATPLVALDSMAHWWESEGATLQALLPHVHLLFVDDEELSLATNGRGTVESLHTLGPAMVVVKHGPRGATLHRRGAPPVTIDACPVAQIADTTGAGDAFAGALVAVMASGLAPGDHAALPMALRVAAAVAACTVEGVGIDGLRGLTRPEVEKRAGK
jgi:ribokinase